MKSILMSLAVLLAASPSFADGMKEYSADSIELLNAATHCPAQMADLAKMGHPDSATHAVLEDLDSYKINFVAGGMPPAMLAFPVGSLTITRTWQPNGNMAPDSPGGAYVYDCQESR